MLRTHHRVTLAAIAVLLIAPGCGKKAPADAKGKASEANKAAKVADKADKDDVPDEGDKAENAEKPGEEQGATTGVQDRIAARLKGASIEFTVRDDSAKRAKLFAAEAQPAIDKLLKFKFGASSVQLSVVLLKDAAQKEAIGADLTKLFGQLKAAKDTYKRFFTRRSEDSTTALLLVFEPADQALAKKVADQVWIGLRCGAAIAHGADRAKTVQMVTTALQGAGLEAKAGAGDAAPFGASALTEIADGKGGTVLVATYADEATAGKWAEAKEAHWQKLYAANEKLTNHGLAGLDSATVKVLVTHGTDDDGNKAGDALNTLDLCLSRM